MDELKRAVLAAFASEYAFYAKTQGFHWNVVGRDFQEYHELFSTIYSEVYGNLDGFAERIRTLQVTAPASLQQIVELSKISAATATTKDAMVSELYADTEALAVMMRDCYYLADLQGEVGFANFLADRMDAYRKHSWMLRSSMVL